MTQAIVRSARRGAAAPAGRGLRGTVAFGVWGAVMSLAACTPVLAPHDEAAAPGMVAAAGVTATVPPADSATLAVAVATALPVVAPEGVGMSAARLGVLDRIVGRGIAAGGYPGAALVVGRHGKAAWQRGYGTLAWSTGSPVVSPESTVYDLASLTKVVATTSAVMALVDDGRLALDAPVQRYVAAFAGPGKAAVTVRHLLEHRSGLPAGAPLWQLGSPAAALRHALAMPLRTAPGRVVEYSDVGMIALGTVVEAAAGEPMDAFLQRRVFGPLGMRQTGFHPLRGAEGGARLARLAPTGQAAIASGRVHDGSAAALGGVAGHAGLFSTATDLAIYAQTLLAGGVGPDGTRVFADSTVRAFLRRSPGTTRRALGWETCGTDRDDVCGRLLDERAVMHTGFTGTYLVLDPARQAFAVLLTNRVHAPRAAQPARVIRDVRADLSDAVALAVADAPGGLLPMPVAFRADRNGAAWQATPPRPATTPRATVRLASARTRVRA